MTKMSDTISDMEFLSVDQIYSQNLEPNDHIKVDDEIVTIRSVRDVDDYILVTYLDDFGDVGEWEFEYDEAVTIYMPFD